MKSEEKKLFVLTRCNTLVNRDLLDKREQYVKKIQKEYKEIYGEKGLRILKNMIPNSEPNENDKFAKRNKRVEFSGQILYDS